MRRIIVPTLALSLLALAPPVARLDFAHGFGQSCDLPLPLWFYLYGAGAAVLASFLSP